VDPPPPPVEVDPPAAGADDEEVEVEVEAASPLPAETDSFDSAVDDAAAAVSRFSPPSLLELDLLSVL
jgi:hypothetical protein